MAKQSQKPMPSEQKGVTTGLAHRDFFTLNPRKAALAWERLNSNVLEQEVMMLPRTLHGALLDTLRERKIVDRLKGRHLGRK